MSKRSFLLSILAGVGIATAVSFVPRSQAPRINWPKSIVSQSATCSLAIDPADLDFGEAFTQAAFPWTIHIHNRSDAPVTLANIERSCDCTSIDPQTATIPPHESVPLNLRIRLPVTPPGGETQAFSVDLTLATDRPSESPLAVVVQGRVHPCPVYVDPADLALGELLLTNPEAFDRTIKLSTHRDIANWTAICEPSGAAEIQLTRPSPEEPVQLHLAINSRLPPGPLDLLVVLKGLNDAANSPSELTIPLNGIVVDDLEAIPGALLFGACPVGTKLEKQVTFHSRAGRVIHSVEVVDAPRDFQGSLISTLGPESTDVTVLVSGLVSEASQRDMLIRFQCGVDGIDRPVTVKVPVNYHGLEDLAEGVNQP
jgi:hypothetical protein